MGLAVLIFFFAALSWSLDYFQAKESRCRDLSVRHRCLWIILEYKRLALVFKTELIRGAGVINAISTIWIKPYQTDGTS